MRTSLVGVVMVLALSGCTHEPDEPATPSAEAQATPSLTPIPATERTQRPPRRRTRSVPLVVGLGIAEAKAVVRAKGFRVELRTVEHSACVKPRVLKQDPPRGWRRDVGTKVRIDVSGKGMGPCGLHLPRAEPVLDAAGRAFVEFARGGEPDRHLLVNDVALYLGGTLLHSIPPQRAVHRLSYGWLCPNYGYYSARTCPFSAVRAIATFPGPMAVTGEAPGTPCGGGRFLHGRFPRTVTLTPDEGRSCVDYFAVELAIDVDGRLEAVNLVWSEP